MEPAYDLKPINNYKAVNAKLSGPSVVKGKIDGKDRVIFKGPSADNTIAWSISTGVADVYSITLSYNNPVEKKVAGHLKLVAADGTLLKEEDVEFTPTREGKTNYISTTTGTMINAGQYTVLLTAPAAENLLINSLDVQ
jgi:beta-galactosidase